MLNSISWQEFLTCLIVLFGGYYFITILLLYSAEITTFFKPKPTNEHPAKSSTDIRSATSIMGPAIQDHDAEQTSRTTVSNAQEIAFGSDDEHQDEIELARPAHKTGDLLVGTIADVIQDIKAVLNAVADAGHDKDETASLFQALLERYPQLKGTAHQDAITQFICETAATRLPFELNKSEVNAWWYAKE